MKSTPKSTGCAHLVLKGGRVYVFAEAHIKGSLATATDRLIGEAAGGSSPQGLGRLIREAARAKTDPVDLNAQQEAVHPVLSDAASNRKRRGVVLVTAQQHGHLHFEPLRYESKTGSGIEALAATAKETESDERIGEVALQALRESYRANDPTDLG